MWVGARCQVYWSTTEQWHDATITAYNPHYDEYQVPPTHLPPLRPLPPTCQAFAYRLMKIFPLTKHNSILQVQYGESGERTWEVLSPHLRFFDPSLEQNKVTDELWYPGWGLVMVMVGGV